MAEEFRVAGVEDLAALGRRLKEAGDGDLRKALLAGIRSTNKPTIASIRASARATLPRSGGLAERVAQATFGTRTSLGGNKVGVRITGSSKNLKNLRRLDRGINRHPVFQKNRRAFGLLKTTRGKGGHVLGGTERSDWKWVDQKVTPGFFTKPIEADQPHIEVGIRKAMTDIANQIERGH